MSSPMWSVQSPTSLHSEEGKSEQLGQSGEPSHGGKDASGDEADDEGLQTYGRNLPGDAEEDRCRRGLHACHRQGGVGSTQGRACIPKGNYTHQSLDMVSSTSEQPLALTNDLENHLTAEEKEKLAQLIRQRKQAVPEESLYEAGEMLPERSK